MVTYKIINGKGYSVVIQNEVELHIENRALDIIHQIANLIMLKKYKEIDELIKSLEVEVE